MDYENLRRVRRGEKALKPGYTEKDVIRCLELCRAQPYIERIAIGEQAQLCFHDAGHILGSAIVEITLREKQQQKKLVFSGDLGNKHAVLMNDPAVLTEADVVMMEGTYGNRNHRSIEDTVEQFRDILHRV